VGRNSRPASFQQYHQPHIGCQSKNVRKSDEFPYSQPPKWLDRLWGVIRLLYYSKRTEDAYVDWATKFIVFHCKRHLREMEEVRALLDGMMGLHRLLAELLYGSGMRILECCRLRIDADLAAKCLGEHRSWGGSIGFRCRG